ncbi:MAG: hypothetical protein ACXAC8_05155 [Candidatus Hodarchaeales archaeon]|jgi:hypothetical protein
MPRKGKGVKQILREEHRLREKKKQGAKYRRKKNLAIKEKIENE